VFVQLFKRGEEMYTEDLLHTLGIVVNPDDEEYVKRDFFGWLVKQLSKDPDRLSHQCKALNKEICRRQRNHILPGMDRELKTLKSVRVWIIDRISVLNTHPFEHHQYNMF